MSEFVGRRREQVALTKALAELGDGPGSLIMVTGGPGSGKSRLFESVVPEAAASRVTVIRSSASAGGSSAPAEVWRQLAQGLERARPDGVAAGLTRALTAVARLGLTPASLDQAAEVLLAQTALGPLALLIDDAHALDPTSLLLLERALSVAAAAPLAVGLAWRPDGGGVAASLAGLGPAWRDRLAIVSLSLEPLPDDDVVALVAASTPDPAGRAAIVRLAAGNPLVALEFARGSRTPGQGGESETVRAVLAERVRAAGSIDLVAALALIDRPATAALLGQVCGTGVASVQLDLQAAIAAGIVLREGRIGQYRLSHPAFGRAVLAQLSTDRIQAMHLEIANAFLRGGGSSTWHRSAAARHLLSSGVGGLPVAQACLDAALWEEENRAFDEAEELATYGLDSQFDDAGVRVQLMCVLGRCLGRNGRTDAALDVLERAVDLARERLPAIDFARTVAELAALDLSFTGRQVKRIAQLEEALEVVDPGSPVEAELKAYLATCVYFLDLPRSRRLAGEAVEVALATGDRTALAAMFDTFAFAVADELALSVSDRMLEVWHQTQAFEGQPIPLNVVLAPSIRHGDRAALDYAIARLSQVELTLPTARSKGLLDVVRLAMAVLDGDEAEVGRLIPVVHDHPSPDVAALGAVALLIWQLHGGDRMQFPPSVLSAVMPTSDLGRLLLTASAAVAVYNDDEGAVEWLRAVCEASPNLVDPPKDLSWWAAMALIAFIGAMVGDEAMCRVAIEAIAPAAGEFTVLALLVPIGPIGWFLGWAYRGVGDLDAALSANEQAELASRRLKAHAWTVHCMIQRAILLADRDPGVATAEAIRSRDEAARLGLRHAQRRAEAMLESLQPSRLDPGSRHHQILQLAARGLTNDQIARMLFLSVSTVERHFTHIYRSLGVRNRAEAVATVTSAAATLGAAPPPAGERPEPAGGGAPDGGGQPPARPRRARASKTPNA